MAIPDFQTAMLPTLKAACDGAEHHRTELLQTVAATFDLTPEERAKMVPSGRGPVIRSRIVWAIAYLKQAHLLASPRRGVYQITKRGQDVLRTKPDRVDVGFLSQYPEFVEFKSRSRGTRSRAKDEESPTVDTPDEALENAYQRLRGTVEEELLQSIIQGSSVFFERLVVELLVAMGYGGSLRDAGQAVGRSGDEGIDGIIKEDRLGLDTIYVQAKKWQGVVGRPEIQKFAGALQGQRAKKGVFLTTSDFSREARDYAASIENTIVLVDGRMVTQLMYEHNIGVSDVTSYHIKKIDTDFFADE